MDGNQISHDLLQRLRDHEQVIEQAMRDYPHRMALHDAAEAQGLAHHTPAARFGAWLQARIPGAPNPARVNVNLNVAVVYVGAKPPATADELIYGGERVEWNQFIDAIKAAVQSRLDRDHSHGHDRDDGQPVIVFVK
jgi:hypothetical protein